MKAHFTLLLLLTGVFSTPAFPTLDSNVSPRQITPHQSPRQITPPPSPRQITPHPSPRQITPPSPQSPQHQRIASCVFCNDRNLVLKPHSRYGRTLAFSDKNPNAIFHAQIMPVEHIESIYSLTQAHVPLLREMKQSCINFYSAEVKDASKHADNLWMVFHAPPKVSVLHLHMHCMMLPVLNDFNHLYFSETFYAVDVDSLIGALQRLQPSTHLSRLLIGQYPTPPRFRHFIKTTNVPPISDDSAFDHTAPPPIIRKKLRMTKY